MKMDLNLDDLQGACHTSEGRCELCSAKNNCAYSDFAGEDVVAREQRLRQLRHTKFQVIEPADLFM